MTDLERYELALRRILGSGRCENSTSGIGDCWRNGRTATAYYGADTCCPPCIAHRALYPEHHAYQSLDVPAPQVEVDVHPAWHSFQGFLYDGGRVCALCFCGHRTGWLPNERNARQVIDEHLRAAPLQTDPVDQATRVPLATDGQTVEHQARVGYIPNTTSSAVRGGWYWTCCCSDTEGGYGFATEEAATDSVTRHTATFTVDRTSAPSAHYSTGLRSTPSGWFGTCSCGHETLTYQDRLEAISYRDKHVQQQNAVA